MEEMLYKFIDEGRRKHKEMGAFFRESKTTNELLQKERNNSLSELEFKVYGLSKAINNAQLSNYEVKGVTTRGGKTTTEIIRDVNKEPPILHHDKPVEPSEVLVKTKPQEIKEQAIQPPTPLIPFPYSPFLNAKVRQISKGATIKQNQVGGSLHSNNERNMLISIAVEQPFTPSEKDLYEKLCLGEPKPTRMSLELADKSIHYPRGIAENVLIKIDKFILPVDFVIFDMREDSKILIILGRPFLATSWAMIDESIDLSDLESCGKDDDRVESKTPIRCIEEVNTPYSRETKRTDKAQNEHLYSASANKIDEKRPVLKDLPSYLEYAYLKGDESGIVLGHKISGKGIEVDKAKIDVIAKLPYPTNVKGVRSFLGHVGFYRRFIKVFSMISKPMTQLLIKDVRFDFSNDCKEAFNKLKEKLTTAPIIISLDWNEPFELMCNASDIAVGAVLGQRIHGKFKPIYYASKTLNDAQAHYTTTEKELLVVVFSFDKFRLYLILSKTLVYTDHSALKLLLSKQDAKPRLIKWVLCPRNEIKKELALLCDRMFPEETDKIERYVGGMPDLIYSSVVVSKPKTMQEAIEMATELMDRVSSNGSSFARI
ncbi:reverse transcriptase domain-containing protein [Tanacetum coccineum]|uniref:RNA-directed DNA polymerase n=1 Tax=Tanacetum coccineum TaxID=301880 RepID=A0ABQ5GCQ1_9ASTR